MTNTVPDVAQLMLESSRIPADPVPDTQDGIKALLIDQILEFQSRYRFSGRYHSRESLEARDMVYLERLNAFQLHGIVTSQVSDRAIGYGRS